MAESTALGVAMAAGAAEGVNVWDLTTDHLPQVVSETFVPQINPNGRLSRRAVLSRRY